MLINIDNFNNIAEARLKISTNPRMCDKKVDLRMWSTALVISKRLGARLVFSSSPDHCYHSVLNVRYGVDHDLSREVRQIIPNNAREFFLLFILNYIRSNTILLFNRKMNI